MLVGTATLALLGAAATACGEPAPRPDVDALVAQRERARSDSELATAVAATAPPPAAKALNTVAEERTAHAHALTDELTRMNGAPLPTPTTTTPSREPPQAPTAKDVVAALRQSADAAGALAAQQSGYRAGLLGSIAAACTAAYTVALSGGPDS
jgi:hypothetical protein